MRKKKEQSCLKKRRFIKILDRRGIYRCFRGGGNYGSTTVSGLFKGTIYKDFPLYPGVRFDIEAEDNSYKAKTTMSKEISGFTNSIKDRINQFNYGFTVFSPDSAHLKKEKIKNIVVYKARTLAKSSDGNYEPLYKSTDYDFYRKDIEICNYGF